MSLKYTFRHLFYGGKIHKDRLYKLLEDLDSRISSEGSETDELEEDVATLKTTVGGSTSGLVKGVSDLETTVGDAESGLVEDVASITTAIGDEETANSILGRIKALEDAQTPAEDEVQQ